MLGNSLILILMNVVEYLSKLHVLNRQQDYVLPIIISYKRKKVLSLSHNINDVVENEKPVTHPWYSMYL